MTKKSVIDRFLHFSPVTRDELANAMQAVTKEEEDLWTKQAAKEAAAKKQTSTDS